MFKTFLVGVPGLYCAVKWFYSTSFTCQYCVSTWAIHSDSDTQSKRMLSQFDNVTVKHSPKQMIFPLLVCVRRNTSLIANGVYLVKENKLENGATKLNTYILVLNCVLVFIGLHTNMTVRTTMINFRNMNIYYITVFNIFLWNIFMRNDKHKTLL